ncbi:MAG: hypothetical protein HeimC3_36660 [Candidatus Heimdallarchaeota archaeon LC_3]|nr:MAG: hypothetical protein HeimC3_36660 [Candidatus Heimdallarchaeota archaeon LC_3]
MTRKLASKSNLPTPNSFWSQYINITKKEIKIQIRYPIAFISSFIQIFMIILVFTFAAQVFIRQGNQDGLVTSDSLSTYMILGLMGYLFFGDALNTLGLSLRNEQTTGTLETLFLYPVNHIANLLAKTTWATFLNIFLTIFGFIVLESLTGTIQIKFPEIIYGLGIFLLYLVQIYGFAFFLSGLNLRLKESVLPLINFLQFFMLIVAAFFFPYSALGPLVIVSFLIPFSYTIDLMRTIIFGTQPELATIIMDNFGLGIEVIILQWFIVIVFTFLLPILGYKYFIKTINDGRASGSLSDY